MAKSQAISLVATEVPAHVLNAGIGRGNEDVGNALQTPRVKLLQSMSPEVDKYSPKYIEGAQPGDFIESVGNRLFGSEIYVINLKFKIEFVVWRLFDLGGGMLGQYPTEKEAIEAINNADKPNEYEIRETHSHVILLKDPETGELSTPMLMDFTVSKLTASRRWNTSIAQKGGDRFASLWSLKSQPVESKTNGKRFMNLNVDCVGWTTEEDYKVAEELYEKFSA